MTASNGKTEETPHAGAELGLLYESHPHALCLLDGSMRVVRANSQFAALLDVPAPSLPGRRLDEVLPPQHGLLALVARARTDGSSVSGTLSLSVNGGSCTTAVEAALVEGTAAGMVMLRVEKLAEAFQTPPGAELSERMDLVLEASRMGTWEWKLSSDVVVLSARAAEIFGVPHRPSFRADELRRMIHPDDIQSSRQKWQNAHRSDGRYDHTFRCRRRDGSWAWIHSQGKVSYDAQGGVLGIIGTVRDITRERADEEARATGENRYRLLFNGADDWVVVYRYATDGTIGEIIDVNDIGTERLGFTREEFLRMKVIDIVAPEIEKERVAFHNQLLHARRLRHESIHLTKWGEHVPVDVSSTLFEFDGQLTVQSICRDISEQKAAERALRESEAFLQRIIEFSPDCIMVMDLNANLLMMSPSGQRGMEIEDIEPFIGKSWLGAYADMRDRALAEQAFATTKAEGIGRFNGLARTQKGKPRWWDCVMAAIPGADGKPERILAISRDVTEERHANEGLRLLASASETLSLSLDYVSTLSNLARAVVPALADWCAIDLVDERGELQRIEVSHVDPEKVSLAHDLHRRFPPRRGTPGGIYSVLETGRTEWSTDISDLVLRAAAADETHYEMLCSLGLRSYILAPLVSRERVLGVITFVTAESGRQYTQSDADLVKEIGRRAGVAVDNAQLYAAAQRELAERRRVEQALRASEATFRQITEGLPHLVWMISSDGTETYYNQRWAEYLGSEPLGTDYAWWSAHVHPEDLPRLPLAWKHCVETGEPYRLEYRIRRASDGEYRWLLSVGLPLRDESGRIVRWFGTATDVHDQKMAAEALRERENFLQEILDGSSAVVYAKDLEGRYIRVNRHWQSIFERNTEQALARTDFDLFDEETALQMRANDQLVLESGQIMEFEEHVFVQGSLRVYLSSKFPLRNAHGAIYAICGVATEVTALKRAEEALAEANRNKDIFLAMLGHELRNPLAAITSGLRLWRNTTEPGRIAWIQEMLERQSTQLSRLLDDLLDVSRITRGKIALVKRPTSLGTVTRTGVAAMRHLLESRRQSLTLDVEEAPLVLDADPSRLEQIIVNLLSNASKYTQEGGAIDVSVRRDGDELVLSVRDNGEGMTAETLAVAFDMFAQGRQGDGPVKEGLGLGLTLVRTLTELHGGYVSATSEGLGKGSEFTVRFPALPVGVEAEEGGEKPSQPANGESRTILVVDDNTDLAIIMESVLTGQGHRVLRAGSGMEALDKIASEVPDVMILDIRLPDLDGFTLAERIRSERRFAGSLLIGISGHSQANDVDRARTVGFDHFFKKPFPHEELLQVAATGRRRSPETESDVLRPSRVFRKIPRVLVIDDSDLMADLTREVLKSSGFDVRIAYEPEEGIRLVGEFRPDVVLCDLNLQAPLSGHDVARHLHETMKDKTPLLIAYTGFDEDWVKAECEESGFEGFLSKPAQAEDVWALLRKFGKED